MYLILIKSLIEELHLIDLIGLSRFYGDPCHDLTVLPYDLTDKGRIGDDNLGITPDNETSVYNMHKMFIA